MAALEEELRQMTYLEGRLYLLPDSQDMENDQVEKCWKKACGHAHRPWGSISIHLDLKIRQEMEISFLVLFSHTGRGADGRAPEKWEEK